MSRTVPTPASPAPSPRTFTLNPPQRTILSRKLAQTLLPPLSTHPYTTINLSGCAIGDAAATEAGKHLLTLSSKRCLQTVILSDIIASLEPDVALRTLTTLASSIGVWKHLISVDLSNNALGSRGLAECAPLIENQTKLQSLFLADTGLAAESARLLCTFFPASTTSLRVLDIHGNRLESQGLIHISSIVEKSPNLKRLRVSSVGANATATATLARALSGASAITELDLSDNVLDRAGAIALAAVLIRQRSLSRLALADLCMRDDALVALLVPLTTAQCPIAELLLAGNELTSGCVTALGRYLSKHARELRVLDLGGNELGDDGILQLADSVRDAGAECALTKVLIQDNDVSSLPVVRLAQELVKLPGMRRYDVRGNRVSARVGESLTQAFGSSVVVYDTVEEGEEEEEEEENGDGGRGEVMEKELENALQTLADVADVVERPVVSVPSVTQSESAFSRIGSWFSRGSASQDGGNGQPSSKVEGVDVGTARTMDDSGIIGEDKEVREEGEGEGEEEEEISGFTTPRIQQNQGVTTTTTTTTEATGMTNLGDAMAQIESDVTQGIGGSSNVVQSAKKLRDSIVELSRELGDDLASLDEEVGTGARRVVYSGMSRVGDTDEEMNRYLFVRREREESKMRMGEILADVCGGLLVALFIIILVLGIVQSQEENTFSYAPV